MPWVSLYEQVGHGYQRIRDFRRVFVRTLRLTWPLLYRQFGADQARASDQGTVDNFRRDCLRELTKLKTAWPDLQGHTS